MNKIMIDRCIPALHVRTIIVHGLAWRSHKQVHRRAYGHRGLGEAILLETIYLQIIVTHLVLIHIMYYKVHEVIEWIQ